MGEPPRTTSEGGGGQSEDHAKVACSGEGERMNLSMMGEGGPWGSRPESPGRGEGGSQKNRLGLLVLGDGEAQLSHRERSPVLGEGRKVLQSRG